uniref:MICOS complex subunit MIC13 n=1 Tax=Amphiprion percula TaxID=161767 RepID=A0A3P8SXM8_AMPPE
MAARILPVLKLATKVTTAGGALYVAVDSSLLGSSEQGSQALEKAKAAIPPAVEEWMKYFGVEECGGPSQVFPRLQQKQVITQIREFST